MGATTFNPYAYYNPATDAMRGGWGDRENAAGRYERWLSDARNIAASRGYALTPEQQTALQQRGLGGIQWAEQQGGGGASGFNWGSYDPSQVYANTYNPGEAIENIVHGTVPQHAGMWGTAGQQQATSGSATPALGDFLHHTLDPTQQLFYQTNPGLYWHWAGQSFAPNVNTPRADWWNNRYQQAQADYGVAGVGDPNLQFTDWLDKNYPQISQGFGLMGAQQRGENTPFLPAGRPQL
jgi:hypothetical protein